MNDKPLRNEAISQLVLASSSPRRKELVAMLDLSLPVYILSTDTDESIEAGWSPAQVVEKLSLRKANAALKLLQQKQGDESSLIIGADTIVVLDGHVLGKPANDAEAISMLKCLQGRAHEVYSGVACVRSSNGEALVAYRMTKVKMKSLSEEQIARYVATGEPHDKAGSYGIQGLGSTIVEQIDGCYFNVVGLPLSLLSDMLGTFDISVF
ncbi:septum formation protein Maf [Paenibacillus sp. FSL H8-0548]|uniref:Maf family protein n=1 Tax=Paenibacillus sp. FSL H8-0548 TaxID=1920422 RepID=UPI00096DFC4F|nr:Maf family protein [Paenibacillus sp. FSL H8-0548]OMF31664.1 septum formation protein Maf [Paenibacillus sp. FSL H8-0548]